MTAMMKTKTNTAPASRVTQEAPTVVSGRLQQRASKNSRRRILASIKTFEESQNDLQNFMAQHEDVFSEFVQLVDGYNNGLDSVKAKIRETDPQAKDVFGQFKVSITNKITIDPTKLTSSTLLMDNVIKEVNRKELEALVADGVVNAVEAENATHTNRSARILGPKKVSLF